LAAISRAGSYDSVLAQAIRNFKYNRNLHAGYILGDLLAQAISEHSWSSEIDVVVPIPAHWTRLWTRRFSHTRLLAEHVSRVCSIPMLPLLRQARATLPQVGLSASAREENIKGAFRPAKRIPIDGAKVCLIDDVMTTGATLREAARTLHRAGADTVYGAVLARTQLGDDRAM